MRTRNEMTDRRQRLDCNSQTPMQSLTLPPLPEPDSHDAWISKGMSWGINDAWSDPDISSEWTLDDIARAYAAGAAAAVAAERDAIIDIVASHGGSVEIEAAIRARGQVEELEPWLLNKTLSAAKAAAGRDPRFIQGSGGGSAHTGPASATGSIGPISNENRQCPTCGITYFAGDGWVHCGDRPMVRVSG